MKPIKIFELLFLVYGILWLCVYAYVYACAYVSVRYTFSINKLLVRVPPGFKLVLLLTTGWVQIPTITRLSFYSLLSENA